MAPTTWLFLFTTTLIIGHNLILAQSAQCRRDRKVKIPEGIVPESASKYPFVESGLQIFTDITVPCNGYLLQWRFLASSNYVVGLHLGVFRQSYPDRAMIKLVAETYIENFHIPDDHVNYWVKYSTYKPIRVRQGDFIGFFYDRLNTPTEMLTIANRHCVNNREKGNTVVYLQDQRGFNKTRRDGSVVVDTRLAFKDCRRPALIAVIGDLPSADDSVPDSSRLDDPAREDAMRRFSIRPTAKPVKPTKMTVRPAFLFRTKPPVPTKSSTESIDNEDEEVPYGDYEDTTTVTTTTRPSKYITKPSRATTMAASWNMVPFTLPKPIKETTISSRCFRLPTMLEKCSWSTVRAFFDYESGTCALFYGCEDLSWDGNNFSTLDECISSCERFTRLYQDANKQEPWKGAWKPPNWPPTLPPPVVTTTTTPMMPIIAPIAVAPLMPVGRLESIFYGQPAPNYGLNPVRSPPWQNWPPSSDSNSRKDNSLSNVWSPQFWNFFAS